MGGLIPFYQRQFRSLYGSVYLDRDQTAGIATGTEEDPALTSCTYSSLSPQARASSASVKPIQTDKVQPQLFPGERD